MKELLKITNELRAPKKLYNKIGKFNYRSCEDIMEAVKPLLFKYNCTLVVQDELVLIGERYYIKATATLKNSEGETETAHAYAREALAQIGMDEAQITGSASSYARKYALNGLFCIDDAKDPDYYPNSQNQSTAPTIAEVVAEIGKCKGKAEVSEVYKKYPMYKNDPTIIAKCREMVSCAQK